MLTKIKTEKIAVGPDKVKIEMMEALRDVRMKHIPMCQIKSIRMDISHIQMT